MKVKSLDSYTKQWVTADEFKQALSQVGAALGEDEKKRIEQMNKVVGFLKDTQAAFNELSQIVDSLALHLRFCMEKVGGFDADGNPTTEFKEWCVKAIGEANKAREAAEKNSAQG